MTHAADLDAAAANNCVMDSLRPEFDARPGATTSWQHLPGSSAGLAIVAAARRHPAPVLAVVPDARRLHELEEELRFYAAGGPELPVLAFPDWESLPYDAFSPHQDITSQRLRTLARLPTLTQGVIVTAAHTLMHRLAPPAYIVAHALSLRVGDRLEREPFRTRLAYSAYQLVSQVMTPGEFAVRGSLFDIFPMGSAHPYRIDLFDEQIETIRRFDPETQRSGDRLERIDLLPAREFPLNPEAIQKFRQGFRARFEGDPQRSPLYRDISKGLSPAGIEYYLPMFFDSLVSLFDYLPAGALVITDALVPQAIARFRTEVDDRYESLRHDIERPLLPPAAVFLGVEEFESRLTESARVALDRFEERPAGDATAGRRVDAAPPPSLPVVARAESPYAALLDWLRNYTGRALIVAETAGRREVLRAVLHDHGLFPQACPDWQTFLDSDWMLGLTVAPLQKGVVLHDPHLAVLAEMQLFPERAAQRRRQKSTARDPEAVIRHLAELRLGDPVVHEDHGVGRYLGLQILDVGDGPTEFLTLEYAGGDKLYTPVTDLARVSRYTGTHPDQAPLHKLGGDAWDKAKRRAREKAHDAAVELLEVQALRLSRAGHAFPERDDHYAGFAAAFPFEETPDQARAIEETLRDMESNNPMDRLVCGDVGFGKTEVALRAAFLAVQGQKQVVVLVPTTLLAQQHFQNFSDRFADTPVRIELLSRFRSKAEQERALAALAAGQVDIVIGTHRLLQEDVHFRNLGLVIIDEEHRFGVRQKERLKKLRSEVDILTLTATPVPRTLNLALAGMRDISLIATAPEARLAVKTFVCQWNDALIREACLRELRRGGQVYYLHNDVRTMRRALEKLQGLVPEADVRIAHGQMPERELEQVMLDFYHQRFNILLCSTIIETGIDVPSANTMIIERADKFGLAQLHQLRGRVGRSHHRAYAYLIVPPHGAITGDALKRLEAIASIEELGAGFALASHDLEIRGAGELLGEAQSGQIDEVGFSMYTELLNRAVASLRAGRSPDLNTPASPGPEINLHVPALLPEDYVGDVHLRLVLYKRLAAATQTHELEDLRAEIYDRFGPLPPATEVLFRVTALKLAAAPLGMRKIEAGPKGARVEFVSQPPIDPGAIIKLLQSAPRRYRLDGPDRLRILDDMHEPGMRLAALQALIDALTPSIVAGEP